MYADHMPQLREHGQASYAGFADLVTFAVLSVRQPFIKTPEQMADVRKKGLDSDFLWGWKHDNYRFMHDKDEWAGPAIWHTVRDAKLPEDALEALVKVPGLGIAKGGFVAQMMGHNVACFDSRNLAKYGIPLRKYRLDNWRPMKDSTVRRKIENYCDDCREHGGAQVFWDDWCTSAAKDYAETPDQISALHLAAIR